MTAISVAPNEGEFWAQAGAAFNNMAPLLMAGVAIILVFGSWAGAIMLAIGIVNTIGSLTVRFFGDVRIPMG